MIVLKVDGPRVFSDEGVYDVFESKVGDELILRQRHASNGVEVAHPLYVLLNIASEKRSVLNITDLSADGGGSVLLKRERR